MSGGDGVGARVAWLLVVAKQTNKPITLVCNYSGLGTGTQLTWSGSEGSCPMSPWHITSVLHVSQGQGSRVLDAFVGLNFGVKIMVNKACCLLFIIIDSLSTVPKPKNQKVLH